MTKTSLMEQARKDAESFEKYPDWKKSALTRLMDGTKLEGQTMNQQKVSVSEKDKPS